MKTITASIYRTDPAAIAQLGEVAWEGLRFNAERHTTAKVRAYCEELAAVDEIEAPRIEVTHS